MIRYDAIRCDTMIRYDTIRYATLRHATTRYDSVCLPGHPEVKAVKLLALLEEKGTRGAATLARAGWAAPGAAGQRPSWKTRRPLCRERGVPLPPVDSQDHFCKCPQLGDEWRTAIRRALDHTVAVELPTFWSSPAPAAGPHLKPKILGALAGFLQHRNVTATTPADVVSSWRQSKRCRQESVHQ